MSAPFGHVTLPPSASTVTCAKYSGSRSGSNTPRHSRPAKSISPTVPSSKVRRNRYSPLTSTPTMSCNCSMQDILRQRPDRLQRFLASGTLPVRGQLALVDGRPLRNQRKRPRRQGARDHGSREVHGRSSSGVPGVEMRACMSTLVPIHPNRDAIEGTYSWHPATIRSPWDETLRDMHSGHLNGWCRHPSAFCAPSSFAHVTRLNANRGYAKGRFDLIAWSMGTAV
jgi:hypothetical protein